MVLSDKFCLVQRGDDFSLALGDERNANSTQIINMLNPVNFQSSIGFKFVSHRKNPISSTFNWYFQIWELLVNSAYKSQISIHSLSALPETNSFGDQACIVRCPLMKFMAYICHKTETVFFFEDVNECRNKTQHILKLIKDFCLKKNSLKGKHINATFILSFNGKHLFYHFMAKNIYDVYN